MMLFAEVLRKAANDPDQPRDGDGKWTSGGGGGGAPKERKYNGADAPRAEREEHAAKAEERVKEARRASEQSKKEALKEERRGERAEEQRDAASAAFEKAEAKHAAAEERAGETRGELEDLKEKGAPSSEVERAEEAARHAEAERRVAEKEVDHADRAATRGEEREEEARERRQDAREDHQEELATLRREEDWKALHEADLREPADRARDLEERHDDAQRDVKHSEAKLAVADAAEGRAQNELATARYEHARDEDGDREAQNKVERSLERAFWRAKEATASARAALERHEESERFWATAREGGDLSDWWSPD